MSLAHLKSRAQELIDGLRARINRHENYQACFDAPAGQEVLRDLCRRYKVGETTFVPGDSHATSYQEGQRSVVVGILRAIGKDTTQLIKQIEEQNHEQ